MGRQSYIYTTNIFHDGMKSYFYWESHFPCVSIFIQSFIIIDSWLQNVFDRGCLNKLWTGSCYIIAQPVYDFNVDSNPSVWDTWLFGGGGEEKENIQFRIMTIFINQIFCQILENKTAIAIFQKYFSISFFFFTHELSVNKTKMSIVLIIIFFEKFVRNFYP